MSPDALAILNALMLSPAEGKQAWRTWRAHSDLDKIDADCLELLPLLSARFSEWFPETPEDTGKQTILGICRRGWAANQLRYRAVAEAITTLRRTGIDPDAVFGPVAWALLCAEEKAVRPIETLNILIGRESAAPATRALEAAGWTPEPGMPNPEGLALDTFAGIWFRSPSGMSLQLAWRLWQVSPELARANESLPARQPLTIQGTGTFVVPTEELLLDALTRQDDRIPWQCDALVLLRNRTVDWRRLQILTRRFPAASARLRDLRSHIALPIPAALLNPPASGPLRSRLTGIWVDYRQVCWARGETAALPGFTTYLCKRLTRSISPGDRERTS